MGDYFSKLLDERYKEDLATSPYSVLNSSLPDKVDYSGDKWYEAMLKGLALGGIDGFSRQMAVNDAREKRDEYTQGTSRIAELIAAGVPTSEAVRVSGIPSEIGSAIVVEDLQKDLDQKRSLEAIRAEVSAKKEAESLFQQRLSAQDATLLSQYIGGNMEGVPLDVANLAVRLKTAQDQAEATKQYSSAFADNSKLKNAGEFLKNSGLDPRLNIPDITGSFDSGLKAYSTTVIAKPSVKEKVSAKVIQPVSKILYDLEKLKQISRETPEAFDALLGEDAEMVSRLQMLTRADVRDVTGVGATLTVGELPSMTAVEIKSFYHDPVGWLSSKIRGTADPKTRERILTELQTAMHKGMVQKVMSNQFTLTPNPDQIKMFENIQNQFYQNSGIPMAEVSPLPTKSFIDEAASGVAALEKPNPLDYKDAASYEAAFLEYLKAGGQ